MLLIRLPSRVRLVARRYFSCFPEHTKITMPKVSPTMTEGKLVTWKKREGDEIAEGEDIAEIESDKATMPISARDDGFMAKIFVQEDTADIPLGRLLAIVVEDEGDITAFKDYKENSEKADSQSAQSNVKPKAADQGSDRAGKDSPMPSTYEGPVGPAVMRLLNKYPDLNLDLVTPTGPKGRILKGDVLNAIETDTAFGPSAKAEPDSSETDSTLTETREEEEEEIASLPQPEQSERMKYTDVPISSMRRAIAKRLNKMNVPHQYAASSFNLDALLGLRKRLNLRRDSVNISVNDFIIKAVGIALRRVPKVNVRWDNASQTAISNDSIDVSMAVAIDGGLITPIVFNADKRGLVEIAKTTKELIAKAREGTLAPEEFEGGCFSVSNLGTLGVSHFSAIINPPQSGILAVGAPSKY